MRLRENVSRHNSVSLKLELCLNLPIYSYLRGSASLKKIVFCLSRALLKISQVLRCVHLEYEFIYSVRHIHNRVLSRTAMLMLSNFLHDHGVLLQAHAKHLSSCTTMLLYCKVARLCAPLTKCKKFYCLNSFETT